MRTKAARTHRRPLNRRIALLLMTVTCLGTAACKEATGPFGMLVETIRAEFLAQERSVLPNYTFTSQVAALDQDGHFVRDGASQLRASVGLGNFGIIDTRMVELGGVPNAGLEIDYSAPLPGSGILRIDGGEQPIEQSIRFLADPAVEDFPNLKYTIEFEFSSWTCGGLDTSGYEVDVSAEATGPNTFDWIFPDHNRMAAQWRVPYMTADSGMQPLENGVSGQERWNATLEYEMGSTPYENVRLTGSGQYRVDLIDNQGQSCGWEGPLSIEGIQPIPVGFSGMR